jgi:NADH-quinone oxidoreductase subunit H
LAISGLGVYGTILAGWASNSKYAFLGALRAAAQMISYEVSLSLTILPVILATGSLNLTDIVYSQMLYGFNFFFFAPSAVIFFVSALAETNRAPFDLAEAEAEIVAGYNLEYSAIIFALFFLGEYGNMTLLSALWVIFF